MLSLNGFDFAGVRLDRSTHARAKYDMVSLCRFLAGRGYTLQVLRIMETLHFAGAKQGKASLCRC